VEEQSFSNYYSETQYLINQLCRYTCMKSLYAIIFFLVLLKVYSHLNVSEMRSRLEVIDEFIANDFEECKRASEASARALKSSLRRNMFYYPEKIESSIIDTFLMSIDLDSNVTSANLLAAINNSELRSLSEASRFQFEDFEGLTAEHNKQALKFLALSGIWNQIDSLTFENKSSGIRPYLYEYKTELDSMYVSITYGLCGKFKMMTYEVNGNQYDIDSLPFNIGDTKGRTKLSILDTHTNEKRWYEGNF